VMVVNVYSELPPMKYTTTNSSSEMTRWGDKGVMVANVYSELPPMKYTTTETYSSEMTRWGTGGDGDQCLQ
jgi:hypothetical protein